MKRRLAWIGGLFITLIGSVMMFGVIESVQFNGLRVIAVEKLNRMTEGLSEEGISGNVDDLLELDGQKIPYEQAKNTFYVSQPLEDEGYAGTFHALSDDCRIYMQQDEALHDKRKAIAEGHAFKIWFVTENAYKVSNLIFTGLPVISIRTEQGGLTEEYANGNITIQNPNDSEVIAMSVKNSEAVVKKNFNSDTITFKLYKKGYKEERNLSLLGLGKRTSWKLYPVYEKDGSLAREKLSGSIWNCVCETEDFRRNMEYAEVIVDGQYKGLYYLSPKIGKGYLGLREEDRMYECRGTAADGERYYEVIGDEDTLLNREALKEYEELLEGDDRDLNIIQYGNFIDYYIYLQAVCGIQYCSEEYDILACRKDNGYEFYRIPERSKYVFGIYPDEIGWQSIAAAEAVMEDGIYDRLAEVFGDGFYSDTAERWRELRGDVLQTERMLQCVRQCESRLTDSGYIARCGEQEAYQAACEALHKFIVQRMRFLDRYFGQAG